ncbi:angiotensin-converting enzyme [Hydra vulgaris]|uniref:angiotensin-converting enzyme n=1 Tax=Hydra vulgaris TaxID=6087 RepID=UPI000640C4F3|nr:angiotensin-converting enzyme [Hydra vulgaris]
MEPRIIFQIVFLLFCFKANKSETLKDVKDFLKTYNEQADKLQHDDTVASWNYEIDMSTENKKETSRISGLVSKFSQEYKDKAEIILKNINGDIPSSLIRQLKLITRTSSSKDSNEAKLIAELLSNMTAYYSRTEIVKKIDGEEYHFKLNSHLLPLMSQVEVENLGNMRWAWRVWREAVGIKNKPLYVKFVELANKAARENGFDDFGDYWRKEYEVENLENMIEDILMEVMPLYKKLHAFTRYKLHKHLGNSSLEGKNLIPQHLLGMWGQNWVHLFSMMCPFPNKTIPDVTGEMKKRSWTNIDLLKQAEEFFVSIGLDKMPESFYNRSLISKQQGKKSVCHPSSWDLGNGDVRLKMPCMGISQGDFITVHHEMGHIEYYLMYKHQPSEFRTGANPGFHEAVGDTIALSVMIPEHLESIGLLKGMSGDEEEEINFLLKQALQKISFLPFSFIIDKWRWSVFRGDVKPDNYNTYWWELSRKYQGMKVPIVRANDSQLFDAGTFFHVAHNTEYLRYFISNVLQFQFHEALCDESGHKGAYHKCSIHKSKAAGRKLRNMLELGKEKPWPEALEVLAGTRHLSSKAILDYFKPLENWLDQHREANGYDLGWDDSDIDMQKMS